MCYSTLLKQPKTPAKKKKKEENPFSARSLTSGINFTCHNTEPPPRIPCCTLCCIEASKSCLGRPKYHRIGNKCATSWWDRREHSQPSANKRCFKGTSRQLPGVPTDHQEEKVNIKMSKLTKNSPSPSPPKSLQAARHS